MHVSSGAAASSTPLRSAGCSRASERSGDLSENCRRKAEPYRQPGPWPQEQYRWRAALVTRAKMSRVSHSKTAPILCLEAESSNPISEVKSVRGLQAESGPQPQFPVVLGQKNEIQCASELDSSHELSSRNPRPRSVEQADSASAASSWARSTSPVSIAFLAD